MMFLDNTMILERQKCYSVSLRTVLMRFNRVKA